MSFFLKFGKIVLWGYKNQFHSHHFIHLGYAKMFDNLGVKYIWVDDMYDSNEMIQENDLIMLPDVHLTNNGTRKLQHKFRSDVFYILHPGDFIDKDDWSKIDNGKVIKLYEYRRSYVERLKSLGCVFDEEYPFVLKDCINKILIQPWGADLEFSDFLQPVYPKTNVVYFIGSVWGDPEGKKNGNMLRIKNIKEILEGRGINFEQKTKLTIQENIDYVRSSRVSFSIGAIYHNEDDYLQCRMFKNIAYGQPTITDVKAFKVILGDSFIDFKDWEDGIDKIMSLSESEYKSLCENQQNSIKKYTYFYMWKNMFDLIMGND